MKPSVVPLSDQAQLLASLVACPHCSTTPLTVVTPDSHGAPAGPVLRCPSCEVIYPPVGGVPCVVPEPERRVAFWRENLGAFHLRAEQSIEALAHELHLPGILPLTEVRLTEEIRIIRDILAEVDGILMGAIGEPLAPTSDTPGFESRESLRSLLRDWGWPDSDENARALACIDQVISAPLGRTLILGAGGCRLAYDLARRDPAALFVAVDDDPLVLLAAARVLRGETLSLTEARALPTDLSRLSAVRTLRTPHQPATRVFPLLADGLRPPFRAGAFDTVVTPWFIDVVPRDLRDLFGVLRRVLADGGRWLHFGPLLYPPERPAARQYSRDEVRELARRAGFTLDAEVSEMLPFSVSPLEERVRIEPCLAICASAGAPPADQPGALPSWLVLPHLPVPDFIGRALFFHDSPGFRQVIHSIDGQRSIDEIAARLGPSEGTDQSALKDAVRQCLLLSHPACQALAPAT